jgi:NAD-dependent DNA ligase
LKSYGINTILEPLPTEDTISIEMTGEPGTGTKEQYIKNIQQINPNVVHLPLTKNTNYLITNDTSSNTTKMNKARKYNIQIITYNDFINLIKHQSK